MPTWKKELLGVADEMAPDEILGEASETTPKVAFGPQVEAGSNHFGLVFRCPKGMLA